jgi:hypothetical protein
MLRDMGRQASWMLVAIATGAVQVSGCAKHREPADTSPAPTLLGHPVVVDDDGRLRPWTSFGDVAQRAWTALETRFPDQDNGLPTFMAYSRFDPGEFWGISWPHNPAGLYAMLTDSALLWYAYGGDHAAVELAQRLLDHQLAHGTTPSDWDWAGVPYASADPGDVEYRGADDAWCDFCGRGDGIGVIEPDKLGELGMANLRMFEMTGEERYRDAARACGDALAGHVRAGDATHSPWPFRVYARTNVAREEYSANVVAPIALFDELVRLGIGDGAAYGRARAMALDWMLRVPIQNDAWSGYFEDIEIQSDPSSNPNQYSALRTASWLLAHPDDDPRWRPHAAHLLSWVAETFGVDTDAERGTQFGALVLSEQRADMAKMGSHTARYAATVAQYAATTGDTTALDRAARSLAWASYTCDDRGIVAVGEDTREGWWFSDGYGDYVRHFLVAMGAEPEWAPSGEAHILRSSSIVTFVDYGTTHVTWRTFDADATETLRLPRRPTGVTRDGQALLERVDLDDEGYVLDTTLVGDVVMRVRHRGDGAVTVTFL